MRSVKHLLHAFDGFKPSEVIRIDIILGVLTGAAAAFWIYKSPKGFSNVLPELIAVVGVMVGAVLSVLGIQIAFLDSVFLRKILAMGRSPVRYMLPFLFTICIGVISELVLILCIATSDISRFIAVSLGGLAVFLSVWTIASLLLCLDTLVQFIELKKEAAFVPDDIELPEPDNE